MDKFKEVLHKMEVVIENDEGISMRVFKALRYGLEVAIKERDELMACEREKQPDTESKLNIAGVSKAKRALIAKLEELDLNYIADQKAYDILADDMLEAINEC